MSSSDLDFSKDQPHSLYREPDREFIQGFQLGDAECVTPIVQTPWCGTNEALDRRVFDSRELTPQSKEDELNERIRRGFDRGYADGELPGASRFRIVHVETGSFEAYVFNFIDVDDEESREWFDRVVTSYQCAMRLGAHVPTAVFGDRWMAVQAIDEQDSEKRGSKQLRDAVSKNVVPKEKVILDFVRFLIVGHGEGTVQSVAMSDEETYSFGSLEFSGHRTGPQLFRFVSNIRSSVGNLGLPSRNYKHIEDIAVELSGCLEGSEVLAPYEGTHISQNISDSSNLLTLGMESRDHNRKEPIGISEDGVGSIEGLLIPDSCIESLVDVADQRS